MSPKYNTAMTLLLIIIVMNRGTYYIEIQLSGGAEIEGLLNSTKYFIQT